MAKIKRRSLIAGQWISRPRQLVDSPVMAVLSQSGFRALNRIESEHLAHGGAENGKLPVTYADFERSGIHKDAVAPALRELEALGIIETTRKGYGGAAELRVPSLYRLTYVTAWNAGRTDETGTHEYLKFKNRKQADTAAKVARMAAHARNSERSKKYSATPGKRRFLPPQNGVRTQDFGPRKTGVQCLPPENGATIYMSEGKGYLDLRRETDARPDVRLPWSPPRWRETAPSAVSPGKAGPT
jgi:hypothetical protein